MIWGVMAVLFLVTAGLFRDVLGLLPPCLFHEITGLPCLTCGATRSIVFLSSLDLTSSFLLNPLIPIFFVGILLFSIAHLAGYIFGRKLIAELGPVEKRNLRIGVIVMIISNWTYLIIAGI